MTTISEWGDPRNYYSKDPESHQQVPASCAMARKWAPLLEQITPGIEHRVRAAVKQWGQSIRDQLRVETGFRLGGGENGIAVPVQVSDGVPEPLWRLSNVPSEVIRLLLMQRHIEAAAIGTNHVCNNFDDVQRYLSTREPNLDLDKLRVEVQNVSDVFGRLAHALQHEKAFEEIWQQPRDWLGAYFYRKPTIEIYWISIGFAAIQCGVDVEPLTYVVLAHELAHAYTHLGQDIDGNRWDTEDFAHASLEIVEGLAQHYTQALCRRAYARYPVAMHAFEALLKRQSAPYVGFVDWVDRVANPGEHMRHTMREVRRHGVRDYERFREMLAEAHD